MIWFGLAGVCFGLIGGMGMGGGIILIPVLTLLLGVGQHAAQALNLAAFLPMSIFALIAHMKQKRVDYRLAMILAGVGLAAALFGAWLAAKTESGQLKILFGCFLIALGMGRGILILKNFCKKRKQNSQKKET